MHWLEKVIDILSCPSSDLRVLAGIAGYDAKVLYKGTCMSGLDLSDQDIDDLELDYSNFTELPFSSAKAKQYIIENQPLPNVWANKIYYFRASKRRIAKINQLSQCVNLREVRLNDTLISDLSALEKCTELLSVEVAGTSVADLTPLRNAKNLSFLDISNTRVSDLSPLQDSRLRFLIASNTNIRSIDPIDVSALWRLDVAGSKIDNIDALSQNKIIRTLNLSSTNIKNVEFLGSSSIIENLRMNNTKFKIPDYVCFHNLSFFSADKSAVDDINFVRNSLHIVRISISNTLIKDLSALSGKVYLKNIFASNTPILDVGCLNECRSLFSANFANTDVENFDALAGIRELKYLIVAGSKVKDMSAFAKSSVEHLDASSCLDLDYDSIKNLDSLRWLHLGGIDVPRLGSKLKFPKNLKFFYASRKVIDHFSDYIKSKNINAFYVD